MPRMEMALVPELSMETPGMKRDEILDVLDAELIHLVLAHGGDTDGHLAQRLGRAG